MFLLENICMLHGLREFLLRQQRSCLIAVLFCSCSKGGAAVRDTLAKMSLFSPEPWLNCRQFFLSGQIGSSSGVRRTQNHGQVKSLDGRMEYINVLTSHTHHGIFTLNSVFLQVSLLRCSSALLRV